MVPIRCRGDVLNLIGIDVEVPGVDLVDAGP
jgi:hypothetical protein